MDAGLWVDSYTVNTAISGNGFSIPAGWDGTSVTASVDATTTLTIDDINWAGTKMGKLKTKRFRTGTWAGIGDHAQLHHVKASIAASGGTTQTWVELNKYTGDNIRELKSWMIGRIANIDIFEAHNGTSVGSVAAFAALSVSSTKNPEALSFDTDAYVFRVVSPGAYGAVDLEGGSVATYVKKLGSAGWKDLINQRAGVGIKIFYGAKNLAMDTRCVEIYSGFNGIFE